MVKPVILALGAHPDDVEMGCGATLALHPKQVHIVTLTPCGVEEEWVASMALLKPASSNIYHLARRTLNRHDIQERVREILEVTRDKVNPDIIFTHHPRQYHQDHQITYQETVRVFKWHTVLSYSFAGGYSPNIYIPITEQALDTKIAMVACYTSQHTHKDGGQPRYIQNPEVIRGTALLRGAQVRRPLAEAFELVRGVWSL